MRHRYLAGDLGYARFRRVNWTQLAELAGVFAPARGQDVGSEGATVDVTAVTTRIRQLRYANCVSAHPIFLHADGTCMVYAQG